MFTLPFPLHDANPSSGSENLGNLPEWDLTDLYPSQDDASLKSDLDWLNTECAAFAADYEGKLADLSAAEFLTCVHSNEQINSTAGLSSS